jgi:capsular polysaccharide biosynthesis protein
MMEQQEEKMPQQEYYQDDEITLKELILKIQEYWQEILKNWKLIFLIIIPFVAFFFIRAFLTPATYSAQLTFMVNEDEGGGGFGGVSAILGQFGFGGGGKSSHNLDKILELSRSRKIIQMALLESVNINGKKDYLANHLIEEYEFHEKWKKDTTGLINFLFVQDSVELFSRVENKVLKSLHSLVIGEEGKKGLLSFSYGEESGILNITHTTTSEELSIFLTEKIYEKLSWFYINNSTEKQQKTFSLFKNKADSLQIALNSAQYRLFQFDDTHKGMTLKQSSFERVRLQQEIQKLILAYGESYKNQEVSDFALKNQTPFIQEIDMPISPIEPIRESKLMALIMGSFIGGFMGIGFFIGRKIFRNTMKN